jgi:hypothetical protein
MNNEEILEKAMDIAFENGWRERDYQGRSVHDIVFDHDFAKTFWNTEYNEDVTKDTPRGIERIYCWKTHLKKMVLEKDPLKYIEKFIN